jgi:hypothetical protein
MIIDRVERDLFEQFDQPLFILRFLPEILSQLA